MEIPFQIIFSVIAIFILISSILYFFGAFRENVSRNNVFNSFHSLVNSIENMCWSFPFSSKYEKLVVNDNVIAVFAHHEYILSIDEKLFSKDISEGDYLCLAYESQRVKCEKLSCNITFKTYLQNRSREFLDFLIKVLYGSKEFEINYMVYRNFTKVNVI